MPDSLQPGPHLSPDQLSAFAENVLPEHERLAALTHLADCPDCRQVVFLTQQAGPSLASAPVVETPRRSWFSLPQILVATTAALACTLILALIVHFRPAQTQAPVTTAAVETPPPIAPVPPTRTPAPQKSESALPPTSPAKISAAAAHSQDESPTSAPSQLPLPAKIVPHPIAPQPSASLLGGSYHGAVTGSDHLDSTHSDESRMRSQQYVGAGTSANGMLAYAPPKAPTVIDGTIPQAAPAPAQPASRQSITAADTNSIMVNGADVDALPSTGRSIQNMAASPPPPALPPPALPPLALPGNKPVASQLFAANRILALDTAGALFITYDSGKHWTAVASQWSGKAVLLSFAPSPTRLYQVQPQQTQTQQQAPAPTAGFELTTATGAVWLSTDGLTWRPR